MATTRAFLGAGAINFTLGAALVMGMDIGTTGSALLASVGGSCAMRQTGVAHVVSNLVTGATAFLLLGLAVPLVRDGLAGGDDQTAALHRHWALLHEYDHLHRLHHRCTQTVRVPLLLADPRLRRPALLLGGLPRRMTETGVEPTEARTATLASAIAARMQLLRAAVLEQGTLRPASAAQILALTHSMRQLERTLARLCSIAHYQIIASPMGEAATRPVPKPLADRAPRRLRPAPKGSRRPCRWW